MNMLLEKLNKIDEKVNNMIKNDEKINLEDETNDKDNDILKISNKDNDLLSKKIFYQNGQLVVELQNLKLLHYDMEIY